METPAQIKLATFSAPIQTRADLTPEQVQSLLALIASSNLIEFPQGKTAANTMQLSVMVKPDGTGILMAGLK